MKKLLFLTTCLTLAAFCALAQTESSSLSGTVTDSAGNRPIAGASVFLNSTSRGTATRSDGSFVLKGIPGGKFELVVSAIGYNTFVTTISGGHLPPSLSIVLRQKATELAALTVEPSLENGWERYGKIFKDNFIGTLGNSSSCILQNRKALKFHFHKKNNYLTVTADEPLMITNGALGYVIQYKLERFVIDFNTHVVLYEGYPFFQEEATTHAGRLRKWEEHRQTAYKGSIMHFMRDLYQGEWKKDGFAIMSGVRVPNPLKTMDQAANSPGQPDSLTRMAPVGGDSLVTVNEDQTKNLFFNGTLIISFGNPAKAGFQQSTIRLVTPAAVLFGANGSFYPPQELMISGYWGQSEKIENLLPLDYAQPPEPPVKDDGKIWVN
jgi:hypothetical protein